MKLFILFALAAIALACEREEFAYGRGCCGQCAEARLRTAVKVMVEREECEEREDGCCGGCGNMQSRLNQIEKVFNEERSSRSLERRLAAAKLILKSL